MPAPSDLPTGVVVEPGPAAVCPGTVLHQRRHPSDHRFTYPVSYVWLDPDDPDALVGDSRWWSARRPAPAWFRRRDYFDGTTAPMGGPIRAMAGGALGREPAGPIRMLTQPRTWGWLFNPITVYLLWDGTDEAPVGPVAAVLEVTNTPWKERHHYPVALQPAADDRGHHLAAWFDKVLHVSPFLHQNYRYRLRVAANEAEGGDGAARLAIELDVHESLAPDRLHSDRANGEGGIGGTTANPDGSQPIHPLGAGPVLSTRLVVDRLPAHAPVLAAALRRTPLSTHRVSIGIHRQALALWRKRVPFVAHPKRTGTTP